MSVLLQLSDSHFGTEQAPVVEALVALAQQQRPDLLVLSGDITQRATRSQFSHARAFTDRARTSGLLPSRGSVGDCYDNAMIDVVTAGPVTDTVGG